MAGIKALVTLAFLASLGVMFLILACALPRYDNWWPLFVLLFYVLAPLPNICSRSDNASNTSPRREFGWFVTAIIVVSAFALPIILARADVIYWGACWLVLAGDVVTFLTIFGFVIMADSDDIEYSMW